MFRLVIRRFSPSAGRFSGRNFHYSFRKASKNMPEHQTISEKEKLSKLRKIEVIQGLLQGTGFLVILIGGFMVFTDYNQYKQKFLKFFNLDDKVGMETAERVAPKPKPDEYFTFPSGENSILLNSNSNPGVYLWGSNVDGVVNPTDLKQRNYKFPVRLPFFNNMVLKDMKINLKLIDDKDDLNLYLNDEDDNPITTPTSNASSSINGNTNLSLSSAFAIDSNGDLIQWGKGFNSEDPTPKYTLRGHKLTRGEFTRDKIYLMNDKNELIWIPINAEEQNLEIIKKNWLFQDIAKVEKIEALPNNEKIVDFDTGISHLVILSDKQKAYVAATTSKCKNFGQFGLLDYATNNNIPEMNKLHELFLLNNELIIPKADKLNKKNNSRPSQIIPRDIVQIAVGNYHTLARDSIGNVYGFGKNTYGQLGIPVTYTTEKVATPKKIEFFTKYFNAFNSFPVAIDIKASSHSSYATIITKNLQEVFQKSIDNSSLFNKSDYDDLFYFAMGKGLYGQLGIGHYIHANSIPKKMASIVHEMSEYDEFNKIMQRTLISKWAIGKNHAFITMQNDDVLAFGGNKFGQLGTGKYVNVSTPTNILKIIEPEDVTTTNDLHKTINVDNYLKKLNNRLSLIDHKEFKYINNKSRKSKDTLSQVIVAGNDNSAIYYVSD